MSFRFFFGVLALILAGGGAAGASVTTGSLVGEMIDMVRLSEVPDPFYRNIQYSSYDRLSQVPGGKDWFANQDGFGNEQIPNFEAVLRPPDAKGPGEYLICDVEGAGAIVRTWTARIEGTLRVYLDDMDTPLYEGAAEPFLLRPYETFAGAAGLESELLEGTFYQRNAAYCPMPFSKRCRIVWAGDLKATHFYEVQVRRYAEGTAVQTFRPEDLKTHGDEIRRVAKVLRAPDAAWEYTSTEKPLTFDSIVQPGESVDSLRIDGPGAIEKLSILLASTDLEASLRQTVMHIYFDGAPWAQVHAPVGDFFGAAPGVNPFDSVPFTVSGGNIMTCRYVMPFEREARISFENFGDTPTMIRAFVLPMRRAWDAERSMHFRARWRIDHGVFGSGVFPQDMPYLLANGAGVYVGTGLYLLNPNPVPTPGGNWWGEGDEKIFVDGEAFPSIFGTGSEDYFNYAWSAEDIFGFPYCGQPRNDGPANRGFVTNHRWHILDPIPFKERIAFYMELYPHEPTPEMAYARIGYHYGRPGMMDDHVVITREDVRRQQLPARWTPAARGGAARSEFFEPEDRVEAGARTVSEENHLWTDGRLLRWSPEAAGHELRLRLPVSKPGAYFVRLGLARDSKSGRVSMRVGDAGLDAPGGVVDLHEAHRTMLRTYGTGVVALEAGEAEVVLRFEGPPEGAQAGTVGIDFLWLKER